MSNDNDNQVGASQTMSAAAIDQHFERVSAEQSRFAHLEFKRRIQVRLTAPIVDEFFETDDRDRKELLAHIIDIATVYREELMRLIHTETIEEPAHYSKLMKSQSECLWWAATVHHVYPVTATYDSSKMPLTQEERMLRLLNDAAETFKHSVRDEMDASLAHDRTRHMIHILLEDDIESPNE